MSHLRATMNDVTDSDIIILFNGGISIESLLITYPSLTKNHLIQLKNKLDTKWNKIKRKKNKKYDKHNSNDNRNNQKTEYKAAELDEFLKQHTTFNNRHTSNPIINGQKHNKKSKKSWPKKKQKKSCLIILIHTINDMKDDMKENNNFNLLPAHKIILKAQQTRGYETSSIMFEPKKIMSALYKNTLTATIAKKLQMEHHKELKSFFNKVVILGHCNYYTINHEDSYYNERFLCDEPTPIDDRYICEMNIMAMSNFIQYIIQDLGIYCISLCCCESGTKIIHLECETLDELTDDENAAEIYDIASKYRLMYDISAQPYFVNDNDKKDEHLFVAFKYNRKYAKLVEDLMKNRHKKNMKNICDHSLSVLDVICYELYEQNVLQTLEKPLFINALNGFGYYRYPAMMTINEMNDLKDKIMVIPYTKRDIMSCIFELDKKFSAGPLRDDCIYYSIKNRDGVQWLIDKDHKQLHKKRNWCQFELTKILDVDQLKRINDLGTKYNEKYFVHRSHVIQYQIHPSLIKK